MSVNITITTAGRAALVNATNTGTAPVTITQVGISQTAVVPSVGATTLAGELKRIAGVAGEVVSADTIHINMTDESSDAYSLRSFALYLASGTLFAIYGQTDPLIVKTAGSIAAISIDTIFADINAALLTFGNANFTNPPATTERQGVVELATVPEAQVGLDALRALTPASAKAAVLGWLLSQDGSGSGLDADMLDGQDGAFYTNIAARLGFTPVNRGGDTMTGLLSLFANPSSVLHATPKQYVDGLVTAAALIAKIVAVDGSGSGLDADLLDGQDGSFYANIVARLGFSPVQQGTGIGQLQNLVKLGWSGSRLKATVDNSDQGNIVFDGQLGDVWRNSNDGSGSGLDADMLDGLHATDFVRSVDSGNYGSDANGYWERRPNGVWEMWGQVYLPYVSNVVTTSITFPRGGFPSQCQWVGGNANGPANPSHHPIVVMSEGILAGGCTIVADTGKSDQQIQAGRYVMWRAIGI